MKTELIKQWDAFIEEVIKSRYPEGGRPSEEQKRFVEENIKLIDFINWLKLQK